LTCDWSSDVCSSDLRVKALKQGVKDNKVHIGLWANLNNYLKTRRKKNGKVATYYISLQKLAY